MPKKEAAGERAGIRANEENSCIFSFTWLICSYKNDLIVHICLFSSGSRFICPIGILDHFRVADTESEKRNY